mmetsp:Transcript_22090/g.56357  ORF Transcript_22090/g.56357 Transcript_22090/m.56357 type:complete len:287 (+) Transcript_22090:39-899(+)
MRSGRPLRRMSGVVRRADSRPRGPELWPVQAAGLHLGRQRGHAPAGACRQPPPSSGASHASLLHRPHCREHRDAAVIRAGTSPWCGTSAPTTSTLIPLRAGHQRVLRGQARQPSGLHVGRGCRHRDVRDEHLRDRLHHITHTVVVLRVAHEVLCVRHGGRDQVVEQDEQTRGRRRHPGLGQVGLVLVDVADLLRVVRAFGGQLNAQHQTGFQLNEVHVCPEALRVGSVNRSEVRDDDGLQDRLVQRLHVEGAAAAHGGAARQDRHQRRQELEAEVERVGAVRHGMH